MTILFVFICLVMGIVSFSRAMTKKAEDAKENRLLEENAEAWERVQRLKLEKKDREHKAKVGTAITVAKTLFTMFGK